MCILFKKCQKFNVSLTFALMKFYPKLLFYKTLTLTTEAVTSTYLQSPKEADQYLYILKVTYILLCACVNFVVDCKKNTSVSISH